MRIVQDGDTIQVGYGAIPNAVLANLGQDGTQPLTTETDPAYSYYHVERTFSEFMLSAYGQQGGAPTNPEFQAQGAPDITHAARCQDCHMRDVTGYGCNKKGAPLRTDLPLHLGVTEAGTLQTGSIKSAIGIGSLLADGIGDTIRVSLTTDSVKEVVEML